MPHRATTSKAHSPRRLVFDSIEAVATRRSLDDISRYSGVIARRLPELLCGATAVAAAALPARFILGQWLHPDSFHGPLLAAIGICLGWRRQQSEWVPAPWPGACILAASVVLRWASTAMADPYSLQLSLLVLLCGLVVFYAGWAQLRAWTPSMLLLWLAIPLPEILSQSLTLPLQQIASRVGAALLHWRYVPVRLEGNIIRLPARDLFVAEACSGLRSLSALVSIGVTVGVVVLRRATARCFLVLLAIPLAILLNGVRVFLVGYFVFYAGPGAGDPILHATEGWLMFLMAFFSLTGIAVLLARLDRSPRTRAA